MISTMPTLKKFPRGKLYRTFHWYRIFTAVGQRKLDSAVNFQTLPQIYRKGDLPRRTTPKHQICRWIWHFAIVASTPRRGNGNVNNNSYRNAKIPRQTHLFCPGLYASSKYWWRQEPAQAMPNTPVLGNNLSPSRTLSRQFGCDLECVVRSA
jgi:hypothetical protein